MSTLQLIDRLRENAERWKTAEQIEDPYHFGDVFADLAQQAADALEASGESE